MRKAGSSTKLNGFQQARRIPLKQNALKIGDFLEIATTALGAGGRAFKSPRPDQIAQWVGAPFIGYGQWASGQPCSSLCELLRSIGLYESPDMLADKHTSVGAVGRSFRDAV